MKHKIGFAGIQSSCWKSPIHLKGMTFLLLLICLGTGCQKAGQIHLISAHTWVVTSVSRTSNIATVGDELVFHDNRLFFNTSNGVETDGQWAFLGQQAGGFAPFNVTGVSIYSDLGSYDFAIDVLTNKALELSDNSSWGSFSIKLVAKE
jgi:hypothetical protein